jgi:hypothetical protein
MCVFLLCAKYYGMGCTVVAGDFAVLRNRVGKQDAAWMLIAEHDSELHVTAVRMFMQVCGVALCFCVHLSVC